MLVEIAYWLRLTKPKAKNQSCKNKRKLCSLQFAVLKNYLKSKTHYIIIQLQLQCLARTRLN